MTFNLPKTLMVLLICLTFVGQAVASTAMSYHMISMKGKMAQEQTQSMAMMDHSNHTMMDHASDKSDESTDDCCAKTCSCFTGSCSSIATLMKDTYGNFSINFSSKIISNSTLALSQQPKSLYRPPIFS